MKLVRHLKYIIMADGKGARWNNFGNQSKHLCEIDGESLIERTIRLLRERNIDEIIVTSHDPNYEFNGAKRYEPKNNVEEIDRFTYELITEEVAFLYGDTYYEDKVMDSIVNMYNDSILFFGNDKSIVAIKVYDYKLFKSIIDEIKEKNIVGKGWTVYQMDNNLPLGSHEHRDNFIYVGEKTIDVNTPNEYVSLKKNVKELKNE